MSASTNHDVDEPSISDKKLVIAECMGWVWLKPSKFAHSQSPLLRCDTRRLFASDAAQREIDSGWFVKASGAEEVDQQPVVPNIFTDAAALMEAEEWLLRNGWTKDFEASGDNVLVQWVNGVNESDPISGRGETLQTARSEAVYQACLAMKGEKP